MHPDDITKLIVSNLPNSRVHVTSSDHVHFEAKVTCPDFAGKTKVQQQQMVYQILKTYIASGEIHALALKTFTPNDEVN